MSTRNDLPPFRTEPGPLTRPLVRVALAITTLCLAIAAPQAQGAPGVRGSGSAEGEGASVVLPDFTVGNSSDRVLLVGISTESGGRVASVTFGGQAFTSGNLFGDAFCDGNLCISQHGFRAEIWSLADPDAQTADITVTFASGSHPAVVGAVWYDCVDTAQPVSVGNTGVVPSGNAVSLTVNGMEATDETFSVLSTKKLNLLNQQPYIQDPAGHAKIYQSISATEDLLGAGATGPGADPLSLTWRWNTVSNGVVHPGVAATVNVRARANTAPGSPSLNPATVSSGSPPGTPIGTLSATDAEGDTPLSFALVSGPGDTDNGLFSISGTELRVAASPGAPGPRSARIRVTDTKGASTEGVIALTVTPNNPPTGMTLSSTSIDEGLPLASIVGTLDTQDPDATDSHTYTLVSGSGDSDNAFFGIAGNALVSAAMFDFETRDQYSVRLRTTDSGGLFVEETFTIDVNDVNEPPLALAGPDWEVLLGTSILFDGSASTDPENNIATYDWDFGDATTGTGAVVNHLYLAAAMVTVTLTVTDSGGLSDSDVAQVHIKSAAEAAEELAEAVEQLDLPAGLTGALSAKLLSARSSYESDRYLPALNTMNAFINQVEAKRGKSLTDSQADALVADALAIIASIQFAMAQDAMTAGSTVPGLVPSQREPSTGIAPALGPNAPNPFRTETRIEWSLPQPGAVSLRVYDILGREVAVLVEGPQPAGHHVTRFAAGDLPGGVYFYRFRAGDITETRRMVVLR